MMPSVRFRVCSLFHHADCNSVLDGPRAKVLGISWSEVGLGYFIACLLFVSLYPDLKANSAVAKVLIEKGEYFEATLDDSSILFGNPGAPMCVTILSNPHCNPCARMHKRVEHLLALSGKDICVQYIFSSFNEQLEDSSRYLIAVYQKYGEQKAREVYSRWYAGEKRDYETIVKQHEKEIHAPEVERELKRHQAWREKSGLVATPTILVNGHKLPKEYTLEDLALMTKCQVGTNS